jgi:transcription elongation factor GreA
MVKRVVLTKQGKERLAKELEELKKVKRPAVVERIKRSRDYGDLSENAEYEDARNEQSFVEGRIQEIEHMLKYAEVSEKKSSNEVSLGSTVKVKIDGEDSQYEIVGSTEADPIVGKISIESPIGSALVGKKNGEKVIAQTPSGEVELKILSVS